MKANESLLLGGGLVVDPQSGTADRKDLLIEGGKIAAVGAPGTLAAAATSRHDARDRLIVPGLVNAHTHGHANLVKGVADAWTLEASLTNGPWLAGTRDPEAIYLSTLLGAIDMLSKGCTACFDLVYEFPRPTKEGFAAAARAYADAGMRAVLAPMVAEDRKSTRLNSSHANISYAVFCLKKNKRSSARPRRRCPPTLCM